MAPLSKALVLAPSILFQDGQDFYGQADKEWGVITATKQNNTYGGYLLALILEACIQFQSSTTHTDPIHLTAHFLRKTLAGPVTVRINRVKAGLALTNITAELLQNEQIRVSAHAVFAFNGPKSNDSIAPTLNPPSSWARRHPLYVHPSQAKRKAFPPSWSFARHIGWTEDEHIIAKNSVDHPNRTNSATVGGGGLEWGGWFEFKKDHITNPALAFLVDIFVNTPALLPSASRHESTSPTWFATVALSVEFKNRIPSPSPQHVGAERTVGIYSSGRFITSPQGRHDISVEIWTSPSNIGEGEPTDSWRENQLCLAIAVDMQICHSYY
ncbi:thioesterase-like superfamily-domain-containing protein [Crepidotus variabilis]|uniref:Thioesterase-like superfamily-domain-containing protein n=1 Tax=Crepidotus variabilis TaxID=179855 RepID=A0A9P6ENN1_9AGAR|nr:thioesterase-like superfamily-domain-containing protein [Crepidotus variabilis]